MPINPEKLKALLERPTGPVRRNPVIDAMLLATPLTMEDLVNVTPTLRSNEILFVDLDDIPYKKETLEARLVKEAVAIKEINDHWLQYFTNNP